LTRARETAEITCAALNCAGPEETDALIPDARWDDLVRLLRVRAPTGCVLLVGHEPSIGRMLASAVGMPDLRLPLPKAAAALVECDTLDAVGELKWLLTPGLVGDLMERGRPRRR
jgi:phosphohistidine phosphatase